MPTTQNIVIDLNTRGANPVAFTHQGDTARSFVFEVYNNGEAFPLTGYTAKIAAMLPADKGYHVIAGENMATGTISDNTITATLPAEFSAKPGNGVLTIILTGSGASIRPINVDFRIQKSADAPETIAGASDFIPILEQYMAENMATYINAWLDDHPDAAAYYITGSKLVVDSNGILSLETDTDEIVAELDLGTLRSDVDDLKSDLLELQNGGYVADAQRIGEVIDDWLDDHPEATTTVQDGAITEAKFADSLKLKAIKDYVTPEMYGAKGDGTTDDTQAWKDAIATGKIVVAVNQYLCVEPLSLGNSTYIFGSVINNTSNGIIVENKAGGEYLINVRASSQTADQFTGMQIKNCNQTKFEIKTQNFYIGTEVIGDETGCAYNIIDRVYSVNSKYFMYLKAKGNGWCNENYFYNLRLISYSNTMYKGADYGVTLELTSGSHQLNSNSFMNLCAEGAYCAINLNGCRDNSFENIRTEGCTYAAIFGSAAIRNVVRVSYGIVTSAIYNNRNNLIVNNPHIIRNNLTHLIATTGALNSRTVSNATHASGDGLYRINNTGTIYREIQRMVSTSDGLQSTGYSNIGFLINVENWKSILIQKNIDDAHRYGCVPFDANGDFVDGAVIRTENSILTQSSNAFIGNFYLTGANDSASNSSQLLFFDDTVKYAYICVIMPYSGTTVKNISIYGTADNYEMASNPKAALASIPTSTGYYIGQEVYSTTNAIKWVWDGTAWVEVNLT